MIDDIGDIREFYDKSPEYEDSRLERHQLEYDLTWRYLEEYLPGEGHILEIGAATGRYTLELARRGYQITAVDLSANLLRQNQEKLTASGFAGQVEYHNADARDLHVLKDRQFDAVLLMGPLYHLVVEADRTQALEEAFRHLKSGGPLFSAFISRFGIMGELLKKYPQWIEDKAEVASILERGRDPGDYPKGGFRGYFSTVGEITPLHENIGFKTMVLAGVEPGISADDESYNKLKGQQRKLWLDLFYRLSTEPTTIGASRHLLHVGRKPCE